MSRFPKSSTPKLTPELIDQVTSVIRGGAYVETAVAFCGISKQTFYRWLREAQADNAPAILVELSDAVKKAIAEAEVRDLAVIEQAARAGVWQAAAWKLERRAPQRWGRKAVANIDQLDASATPEREVTPERISTLRQLVTTLEQLEDMEDL